MTCSKSDKIYDEVVNQMDVKSKSDKLADELGKEVGQNLKAKSNYSYHYYSHSYT